MSDKSRILAVDDDPINLCLLEELLKDQYEVKTLSDGTGFLTTARSFRPDVILLDVMMPGASGYDLCEIARSESILQNVKIILISAKHQLNERMTGYEAGADDYVTKPFDAEELLAKIKVYLRLKSMEEIEQLRSSILTLLNHETRTPLTGIIAPAELMLANPEIGESVRIELLRSVYTNARRLETLVEKAAWLGALNGDSKDLQLVSVDVSKTLLDCAEWVKQEHPDRVDDLHIDSADSVILDSDQRGLSMVCRTLVENAICYSRPGDRIEIDLSANSEGVFLTVTDHGKGIEPEFLPRVFDGFLVGDIAHHGSGNGISLAVSQGIVKSLGGEITASSEPGIETRFLVYLPGVGLAKAA